MIEVARGYDRIYDRMMEEASIRKSARRFHVNILFVK
jgi:hypothetical protein